jgi:hypothetical protein
LGIWGLGELANWGIGKLGTWRIGELGTWGLGELENWGIYELGDWGLGDLGNCGILSIIIHYYYSWNALTYTLTKRGFDLLAPPTPLRGQAENG